MTDDVKIGRARFDAYQHMSPRVESVGDSPNLRYITGAELERLRTRLQRAEERLQSVSEEIGYRYADEPQLMGHKKRIDAFLGER